MLAELAPPAWRPVMRLVAFEIADRSPDPTQLESGDQMPDGSIRSRVLLEGHKNKQGKYIKGLTDYLGMEKRQVCDALAALSKAGFEMRVQLLDDTGHPMYDKLARPLFAVPGRAMRFKVAPLSLVLPVDNPTLEAGPKGTQKGTHEAGRVPFGVPSDPARVPKKVPVFPTEDLSLFKNPFPDSAASVVNRSVEGTTAGVEKSDKTDFHVDNEDAA
jgi:hypothetical protein